MARQTIQLATELGREGVQVHLVQTNAPYRPAWLGSVKGLRALARLIGYVRRLRAVAGHVDLFHIMANSGWSWHLFAVPAILIGSNRGVRLIVNYHGGEAEKFLRREARWVLPALRRAAALVVPSVYLQRVFRAHRCDSIVIPNIVDLGRFHPAVDDEPHGRQQPTSDIGDNPAATGGVVLFVPRNLERIYDIETALRALTILVRSVPLVRMVIAGSGSEEGSLRHLAASLGVEGRVKFAGRLDLEQMAEYYREASVVLNPSRVDNAPVSLLEALASGVPVVTTNVGGIPWLVEDGRTALLVPPGDPMAMANAVVRVLAEPGLAQALRSAGLVDAKRYAWSHARDLIAEVYRLECDRSSANKCALLSQ